MTKRAQKLTRRRFLNTAAAGACGLALEQAPAARFLKTSKKPNILWIMSDEHNPHVAGYYGNQVVQTPNIDALCARDGITFDGHYCNSPLCVPSRLSLTAGKVHLACGCVGPDKLAGRSRHRFSSASAERCRLSVLPVRQAALRLQPALRLYGSRRQLQQLVQNRQRPSSATYPY